MNLKQIFLTACIFAAFLANAQNDTKKVYHSILLNVNGEEVEVPALLLDSGRVSLYKVIDYYLKISTNSKTVVIQLIKENDHYKNQIKEFIADCPAIARLISKTRFTNDGLVNIVHLYNNCSSISKRRLYSPTFNANLGIGLSFIAGSIKSSEGYTKKLDWSFEPAATFYVAAALTPSLKKNIAIEIEVSFSNRTIEGYSKEKAGIATSETLLTIKNSQFSTGLRFVQYRKAYKQIQSFYSAAIGGVFTSSSETELWNIDSYGNNVSVIKNPSNVKTKSSTYFSFSVGARKPIETNYSLGFELRFDLQPNQIQGDGISKNLLLSITPTLRLGIR